MFHLIAAEISGMRRSLGNKYGFRFWCWNAPFLPMIAPFLPVIAPSLPVQNFHCAVFVELRHVFYIAPFLWTCAWFFCRLGMRPKFWIHESLGMLGQNLVSISRWMLRRTCPSSGCLKQLQMPLVWCPTVRESKQKWTSGVLAPTASWSLRMS